MTTDRLGDAERCFDTDQPCAALRLPAPGVLVTSSGRVDTRSHQLDHVVNGRPLWWTPTVPNRAEVTALDLAWTRGVATVTIAPTGVAPWRLGLAAAFSAHLRAVRRTRFGLIGAFVTSPTPPASPRGVLRLPHLVMARHGDGRVEDTPVWELLPADAAHRWLHAPLPDLDFRRLIEERLSSLLRLRRLARHGHLPGTAAGRAVATLLTAEQYLSLRLVYLHPQPFRALLEELATTKDTAA